MLHLLLLIFVGLSQLVLALQAPTEVATSPASAPEKSARLAPVRLPNPITQELLERYCDILGCSEAQRIYADFVFHRYREQFDSIRSTGIADVLATYEIAIHAEASGDLLGYAARYADMYGIAFNMDDKMVAAENTFFSELESFLAESQRPQMARVRMHRTRDRSPQFENYIHESTIDIAALVELQNLDPQSTAIVDPLLLEYERAITPWFAERDRIIREHLVAANDAFVGAIVAADGRQLDFNNPGDKARFQANRDERARILAEVAAAQKKIARANRDWLPRIMPFLPSDTARNVKAAYDTIAWRYVYPDTTDPNDLLETMLSSSGLDPELRMILESRISQYRSNYEALCSKARRLNELNEEQFAGTNDHSGMQDRRKEIWDLIHERVRLNRDIVATIAGMVPPEIASQHAQAIRSFDKRVAAARPPLSPVH
jgi:hypothetical protein